MTYLMHWVPTFAGALVLAIAGFILLALESRDARRRNRGQGSDSRAD